MQTEASELCLHFHFVVCFEDIAFTNIVVVDDSTEVSTRVSKDAEVKRGVKRVVDKAIDKVVGDKIQSVFGLHGEETEEVKEQE